MQNNKQNFKQQDFDDEYEDDEEFNLKVKNINLFW